MKALDIYKLLAKKNCKECGFPTCLAFAMKIASGKANPETCPYIDPETRKLLGAATRPPVRRIKIGVGERCSVIGEEFVRFRHEKTFYHPPAIMFRVPDTLEEEQIRSIATRVERKVATRVGQDLFVTGLAIDNASGDPGTFGKAVAIVEDAVSLPEVLVAASPEAQVQGLERCGNYRPLIYGADAATLEPFCALAKKYGAPLALKGNNLDELGALSARAATLGVEDCVLDLTSRELRRCAVLSTQARSLAIARIRPELGFPALLHAPLTEDPGAAVTIGIVRYAGVIITDPLSPAQTLAALTLRQNIYTDPQKPIQVAPGLYRVGSPGDMAPVLLTVNFSLTYFTVLGYLESIGIPCILLVVDTEGLSVLTAVAAGKLNETLVRDSIRKFNLEEIVKHRTLILPGYASPLSGKIQDESGWRVLVGPRDAAELGEFLEKEWKP
jgi:acetyl-CoA decarbonylase/synthase complex subunit gamma